MIQQPPQLSVFVTLMAPVNVGLDQVLATLSEAGITASELSDVYSVYNPLTAGLVAWQWRFTRIIGFDKLQATQTALRGIKAKLAPVMGNPPLTYQVSSYANAPVQSCSYSSLLSDARRQADTIAAAAGLRAGSILSLSDGSSMDGGVPVAVQRSPFPVASFCWALSQQLRATRAP